MILSNPLKSLSRSSRNPSKEKGNKSWKPVMDPTLKIPAHTLLGQRAINAEHKQQHGRRVLRATFYTIQRRYASYCLVPSCLAGTQPESCTNTLGELQVISFPALASWAEP